MTCPAPALQHFHLALLPAFCNSTDAAHDCIWRPDTVLCCISEAAEGIQKHQMMMFKRCIWRADAAWCCVCGAVGACSRSSSCREHDNRGMSTDGGLACGQNGVLAAVQEAGHIRLPLQVGAEPEAQLPPRGGVLLPLLRMVRLLGHCHGHLCSQQHFYVLACADSSAATA